MKFTKTSIEGLVIIEPRVFGDERGYFLESYNEKEFEQAICKVSFVQDNESKSSKGVLRGLHYQKPPFNQAKLVRCIAGRVLDVAVDIRKGSPTYGKHVAIELSGENKKQVYVPKGFAHGFSVLSETAVITYKVDSMYAPEFDSGIRYDDTELGIDWGLPQEEIQLSEKDKDLPSFKELDSPFKF
jgi:dTDP-4-dehydrorhamnose 3,5-epimerase